MIPRVFAAALVSVLMVGCAGPRPQKLPRVTIEIGDRTLSVEVASTEAQRATGMMYRKKIGPDEGMLFAYPQERKLAYYMKNTYVPLSIAFLDSGGVIVNIATMEPLTTDTHWSRLASQYALEMPAGWFERNNVREGVRVKIPAIAAEE